MKRASIVVLGCSFLLISLLTNSLCQNERRGKWFSVGGRAAATGALHVGIPLSNIRSDAEILGPETASIAKVISDPIQSLPKLPQVKYIRQAKPPVASGVELDSLAEGNNVFAGEVINPGLLMCQANWLDLVKTVGDKNTHLFRKHSINEINLFARTVPAPTGGGTLRVEIGPAAVHRRGSALNVLVEYRPLELNCSLPTLGELENRLAKLE